MGKIAPPHFSSGPYQRADFPSLGKTEVAGLGPSARKEREVAGLGPSETGKEQEVAGLGPSENGVAGADILAKLSQTLLSSITIKIEVETGIYENKGVTRELPKRMISNFTKFVISKPPRMLFVSSCCRCYVIDGW